MKLISVSRFFVCSSALLLGCSDGATSSLANGAAGQVGASGAAGQAGNAGGAPVAGASNVSAGTGGSDASGGSDGMPPVGGSGGADDTPAVGGGSGAGGDEGVAGAANGGAGGAGNAMGPHPDCPNCVSIFDGQTLDGWQPIGAEQWEVDDTGAIFSTGASAGALVTTAKYNRYRLLFSWQWLGSNHQANMLIWCRDVGARNCAGVQFQPPGRDVWDYGPANTSIKGKSNPPLMAVDVPKGEEGMCELLVDSAAGTFKGGCCALDGAKTCKTSPVVNLTYGSALPPGELGFQAHNADHRIRWWDIFVEEDPVGDELVTAE